MKKSQFIAVIIALVVLVWIVSGLVFGTSPRANQDDNQQAAPKNLLESDDYFSVRVRSMTAQPYRGTVKVTGRSQASQSADIKAEIDGPIEEITVEEGALVEKGQVLARLELRDKKARMLEAQGLVNQRSIQFKAAKELEREGFNSEISLAQAKANLESAKAALAFAKNELNKVEIRAPFAGIVDVQDVDAGDFLTVMGGSRAFRMINLDPLEIDGYVSERQIASLSKGMAGSATFLDGSKLDGELSFIAPAADENTRTFRVILTAPNPDHRVKAGLTASLEIPIDPVPAYKISPSILTLNDAGRIGLYIVDDQNRARFKPVDIIADLPSHMWVGGLPERARIISVGQEFVTDGQNVNPVEAQGDGLL